LNKAGFITKKPKGSVVLGIINTIYKGNLDQSVHCCGSSGLCGADDSEAKNVLPASLTPKFFFVISNERLVRAIFKFEREGSRGVYELPTKGEVVDVLYVLDLLSAVILKLSSNRYCLCSFLPLLFEKLRDYYGAFYFTRAGRI
jgi:hypothetical protein